MSRNYTSIFDIFDDIMSDAYTACQPSRFNKAIASGDFPPTNVKINQTTKELTFKVALAGIKENEINLSWDSDYLVLKVDHSIEDTKKDYIIQRGFREVNKIETRWGVDPRYYDRDAVTTIFENGLLTIVIKPRSEVAPKKVTLFGGLTDKAQIEEKKE